MKLFSDRIFSIIVLVLVLGGTALFFSASLGLLARVDSSPWHLVVNQIGLGLLPGFALLLAIRYVPQKKWASYVFPLYIASLILALLVFVPHVGLSINGAHRWINLRFTTFQPSEVLKITVILMFSAYLANAKEKVKEIRYGLLAFIAIVGIPCVLLLLQPNTSTVLVIGASCTVLYIVAGAPLKHLGIMAVGVLFALTVIVFMRPYLMARVQTFIHPGNASAQGSGYHIQQSLIAIGSGKIAGRGFGQSVQKFNYLPEAESDSVFAVYGEEFGFIGTVLLVLLFTAFALRGFMIAAESSTLFGTYVVTGLTLLITISAFLNIGALLGLLPLTGLPLPFISHGGTALMAALASVGIILNIAAQKKAPSRRSATA
jgi:cell division protein FtsW